ncbi:exodeoxyribonuclease VII large subunit [Thermoflexus sp.]|uniref:exodeoxyribonuclease VII large subunit n=1 Tax=Thermoflexus sp. TaxID=1969742 RepID=UPI0025D6D84D|nr:exodeoxyribonuclease VII large subunit [Thermoflexus sp.]MDW8064510.1 exodeoxyribonuclease VII large subunit [Anaerolineae bacterium]MCS6964860.1 exodeoxyribonuclease VII large subunit [Thermoflexus sp.]MCS7350919.1 exodeoxyribonuclease VII large subunit [Thermoflexus sp.]MCX7690064.1 exodeoxyribonuclease VII large subunit [Thermoflexus sp.]MDW8180370.1 exodeoxyribonuclease VII large subunit [Anaerolineae bacterium]
MSEWEELEQVPITYLTVSQLAAHLKEAVESRFAWGDLWVEGEVGDLRPTAPGHVFFSLKEGRAQVTCVIWRTNAARMAQLPANGQTVVVRGRVGYYEDRGDCRLYVDRWLPIGLGQRFLALEALKRRLEAEGLFDPARKRSLPAFPRRIGVVTSPAGAALRDILNILRRRWPLAEVILSPTVVQGEDAPLSIAAALEALRGVEGLDLVILARGGGSNEELWAFNDERVVRAVASSPFPVVSGVGHAIDLTLADAAADVHAPTPSAAAELATPDREAVVAGIAGWRDRLMRAMRARLERAAQALETLRARLQAHTPERELYARLERLHVLQARLEHAIRRQILQAETRWAHPRARLEALNPRAVLARGYAIVRRPDGRLVTRADQAQPGERLILQWIDGEIPVRVEGGSSG